MREGIEYYKTHKFMENGRCLNCQIKPFYLSEFIEAYNKGNITEEELRSLSECHDKVKL